MNVLVDDLRISTYLDGSYISQNQTRPEALPHLQPTPEALPYLRGKERRVSFRADVKSERNLHIKAVSIFKGLKMMDGAAIAKMRTFAFQSMLEQYTIWIWPLMGAHASLPYLKATEQLKGSLLPSGKVYGISHYLWCCYIINGKMCCLEHIKFVHSFFSK
jgi:hypothetical protein